MIKHLLLSLLFLTSASEAFSMSCADMFRDPISQNKLKELTSEIKESDVELFVKDMPIFAYKIPKSIEEVPTFIREKLGEVDQATYSKEYFDQLQGGVVILQLNGKQTDFYPIKAKTFNENYKVVSVNEAGGKNEKLANGLAEITEMQQVISGADPNFIGVLKTKPVEMVRMSRLGMEKSSEITIEAPWGGNQVKSAGTEAYLVLGKENYMVNLDSSGLPIGYIRAE